MQLNQDLTKSDKESFYSVENMDVLLSALKEFGGVADKRQLFEFLWRPENREKFKRPKGRAWAIDRIQHDLYGLCQSGRVILVRPGFVYYLSEKELWA